MQRPVLDPSSILYIDEHIVAVDKESGMVTDATRDPNRPHLAALLQRWQDEHHPPTPYPETPYPETPYPETPYPETPRPEARFLAVHRLDAPTSGVVVFARHQRAATVLMEQFRSRSVDKRYQAIVRPAATVAWDVGDSFERSSYLRHAKGITQEVRSGGKPSHTRFDVSYRTGDLYLLDAFPSTGRTHQIRVHLAAIEAPIVGDDRYCGAPGERLWLHASELQVDHPASGERLRLSSRSRLELASDGPVITAGGAL